MLSAFHSACAVDDPVESRAAAISSPAEVARTRSVGAVEGALEVGNDGNAYYSVDLRVVPGRNNMQPSLALQYVSDDSIGPMGRGWSLTGAPSITRCERTVAVDGYARTVHFDEEDAYCLDGQRLIRQSDHGDYVDFRTEHESFNLIRAYEGEWGFTHWRVRGPDGTTSWYGLESEGAQSPLSLEATIASWMLAKVEDPFGNSMRYVWSQPYWPEHPGVRGQIGEVVIERIEYATHTSGLQADREVRFSYGTHTEARTGYHARLAWRQHQRLEAITMVLRDNPVWEYRMTYREDGASSVSRLEELTECVSAPADDGVDVVDGMVCLPPTKFFWSAGREGNQTFDLAGSFSTNYRARASAYHGSNFRYDSSFVILDMNGDGATDIVYQTEEGELQFHLSTPYSEETDDIEFGPIRTNILSLDESHSASNRYYVVDWNMDGRDDLMLLRENEHDYAVIVLVSTGYQFEEEDTGLRIPRADALIPVDDEEDEHLDAAVYSASVSTPSESHGLLFDTDSWYDQSTARVGDFNGDGHVDLLTCEVRHDKNCHQIRSNAASAAVCTDGEWYVSWGQTGESNQRSFGARESTGVSYKCGVAKLGHLGLAPAADVTGDGILDVFLPGAPGNYSALTWSPDGGFSMQDLGIGVEHAVFPTLTDVNGDGLTDVVVSHRLGGPYGLTYTSAQAYAHGAIGDWSFRVYLAEGDGVFRLGEADMPSGWTDENTIVGYRFSFCTSSGFSACPEGDRRYAHLPAPQIPMDLDGDGRMDIQSFAYPHSERIWRLSEPEYTSGEMTSFAIHGGGTNRIHVGAMDEDPVGITMGPAIAEELSAGVIRPWQEEVVRSGDFDGDGQADLVIADKPFDFTGVRGSPPAGRASIYLNRRAAAERIVGIEDGVGDYTTIHYGSTADPELYTRGEGCQWPQQCDSMARWVVRQVLHHTARWPRHVSYTYADSRTDLLGRGWLGFARRTEHDEDAGQIIVHHMDNHTRDDATQSYPYAGRVFRRLMLLRSGDEQEDFEGDSLSLVAAVDDTSFAIQRYETNRMLVVESGRRQAQYREMEEAHPVNSNSVDAMASYTPFTETTVSITYDETLAYGQRHIPVLVETTHPDGRETQLEQETAPPPVGEDATNSTWQVGRIASRRERSLDECATNVSFRAYYEHPSGALTRAVRQPEDLAPGRSWIERLAEEREAELSYDVFGHIVATTLRTLDGEESLSTVKFTADDDYTYPATITNPAGHETVFHWREMDGTRRGTVDANGVARWVSLDGFGRVRRVQSPGEPDTLVSRESLAPLGGMAVTTEQEGSGYSMSFYDSSGLLQERRWLARNEDGDPQEASMRWYYDGIGRLSRVSVPSFGSPEAWTSYERDTLGVLRRQTDPRGSTTHYWHTPTRAYQEDALGRVAWSQQNEMGHTEASQGFGETDPMVFERCVDGRLLRAHDPVGNTTYAEYDSLGRQIMLDDPDSGKEETRYNAFDQIVWSRDAENRITERQYDALGRLVKRSTSAGELELHYDSPGALGLLSFAKSEDGIEQWLYYDEIGRPIKAVQNVDGIDYTFTYEYDGASGRLHAVSYPSLSGPSFVAKYTYDDIGGIEEVTGNQGTLWQAGEGDAQGRLLSGTFGNGFETHRQYLEGTDLLHTLTTYGELSGEGVQPVQDWTYAYDDLGRVITQQDDAHGFEETFDYWPTGQLRSVKASECDDGDPCTTSFTYDPIGNMTWASDVGTMRYEGAQPHAVSDFMGLEQLYDRTGNHIGDKARRHVDYDGRGFPVSIYDYGTEEEVTLRYGPTGARAASDGPNGFRVYFRGYERRGDTEVFRVSLGSGVAEVSRHIGKSTMQTAYVHRGRTQSVEAVVGDDNKIISLSNYTPFGRRRDLSWTASDDRGFVATDHGFGGHEEEDAGGLIHMGGRQYDPAMRQMTSPDPFVSPGSTIGYNRYSYVHGDPVNFWDPSGFYGVSTASTVMAAAEQRVSVADQIARISRLPDVDGRRYTEITYLVPHLVQGEVAPGADARTLGAFADSLRNVRTETDVLLDQLRDAGRGTDRVERQVRSARQVYWSPAQVAHRTESRAARTARAQTVVNYLTLGTAELSQMSTADFAALARENVQSFQDTTGWNGSEGFRRQHQRTVQRLAAPGMLIETALSPTASPEDRGRARGTLEGLGITLIFSVISGMATNGPRGPSASGGGNGGQRFFRGARPGEAPDFTPRPHDFRVDRATGRVRDSHGVSVFDNPESVSQRGFVPHEVDQATVPDSLRIRQRGRDPAHFEITPRPGADLTPGEFVNACRGIRCLE